MYADHDHRASVHSRRPRLNTLMRLRWLAIAGQTATVLFVALYLGFPFPLGACLALIAASAWLNLFFTFRYPVNHRLNAVPASLILLADLLQLAGLLYLTGGMENPFSFLLIIPVIISATLLPVRHTLSLAVVAIFFATILVFFHFPLPWYPAETFFLPRLFVGGIWFAMMSALVFTTFYAHKLANEVRELGDALMATELTLQREQHLTALDGLAAAAAHELGTPLATITLVVREMQRSHGQDATLGEDIALLQSQSARCREILQRLTSLSSENEEHMSRLPLSSLIEEVIAPHRNFGIELEAVGEAGPLPEPVVRRNSGILYGLGNLVENAVDFGRSRISVHWGWSDTQIFVRIEDDGDGFRPEVLEHIGEPYMSRRDAQHEGGGGLGLGMFIAKTLLERSGGHLSFSNRSQPECGARIVIVWSRPDIE